MDVVFGGIYLYNPPKSSDSDQGALLIQSGSEQEGLRPYVVVSRDAVNRGKPTCVGVRSRPAYERPIRTAYFFQWRN